MIRRLAATALRYLFLPVAALLVAGAAPSLLAQQDESLADLLVQQKYTGDLAGMKQRKVIRALVIFSRTDFFFDDSGEPKGLQVDLLVEFQKHLNKGVKHEVDRVLIEYIPTTLDHLIPDLVGGKGDIAAALLTVTPDREKQIAFITSQNEQASELVVTHKSVGGIDKVEDLAGRRVYVLRASSYAEHLRDLNRAFGKKGLKPIEIVEGKPYQRTEDILEMLNAGVIKITVADDYKAALWAQVLPDIQPLDSVAISTGNAIGWGIRKNNPELNEALTTFLHSVRKGTLLGNMLFNRYEVSDKWIENPTTREKKSRLQDLVPVFRKYGDQYGFDHLAVAAQGYQESQLDQDKKSNRGAVGIMQLLPDTAASQHVGIPDISTEEANIHAGVKYMAFLRDHYFSDPGISDENRFAFSLAAYNAGPGNVIKMRKLASQMNLDPNVWHANVEVAAARIVGRQTVQYVSNIFKYYIAYQLVSEDYDDPTVNENN